MATRTPWDPETGDVITEARLEDFPRGWIGSAVVTAAQNGITNEADLTGLTVTFTAVGGRKLKISASGTVTTGSGADPVGRIYEDSSAVGRWGQALDSGTGTEGIYFSGFVTREPSAGSVTYKLTLEDTSDVGVNLAAAAATPAEILVEDIGPAEA